MTVEPGSARATTSASTTEPHQIGVSPPTGGLRAGAGADASQGGIFRAVALGSDKGLIGGGIVVAIIGVVGFLTSGGGTGVDTPASDDRRDVAVATTTTYFTSTTARATSTTTTTLAPEDPAAFLTQLAASVRGDRTFAVARLGDATLERYGADQCRRYVTGLQDDSLDFTVREVGEPTSWDYTTDARTTTITGAIPVEVQRVARGETVIQELHLTLAEDRTLRWYSDCGTPQ